MTEKQFGYYRIVTVGEDVGLDEHLLAEGALDGIAAAVDLGPDRLDHDPRGRFGGVIQA